MNDKLYAERDSFKLGEHYVRHVEHMTSENLYSKADIAAELAHRDIQIDRLERERDELRTKVGKAPALWNEQVEVLRRIADRGLREAQRFVPNLVDLWQHMLDEIRRLK